MAESLSNSEAQNYIILHILQHKNSKTLFYSFLVTHYMYLL